MFLQLTNANPELSGIPLMLNSDHIVTAFEQTTNNVTVTNIFCPPHGTWQVSESLSEIAGMLKDNSNTNTTAKKTLKK